MSSSYYEQHAKTKGNQQWEAVVAPIDCSYYSINGGPFDKCSDVDSEIFQTFASGFAVTAPPMAACLGPKGSRWAAGDTITWVRSSQPLDLYFLR